jgi:hypothetical protein
MKNDKTDTPRTDAVFWKFHTHDDIVNLARDLERELAISLENQCKAQAEVERLRSQFNRTVEIAEMFQRGNSGLHYQCQCRSCQMLAELKGELERVVYGCDCDNFLQTYCDKHNPHTNQ